MIGHWLGVVHQIGQALYYWILPESGISIVQTMIQHISQDELAMAMVKELLIQYEIELTCWMLLEGEVLEPLPPNCFLFDEDVTNEEHVPFEPDAYMPEAEEYYADAYDKYISAEVMLPKGDALECAHIVNHKQDNQGNPIGEQNSNPILDTHVYDVQFSDGHVEEFSAKTIVESLYS